MTATIQCAGCQHAYIATALFCPNCGRPKPRDASADPLLGKLLGERFLVHEILGQGGSGTIYRAEHVTLRRKVAIKVLHSELSRDDLAVERFRREATTVAEIDNEHIVEIHDFGRTPDGRLYLAMELLEGETLDGVLARDKQLSVERTADILIQVGEALMEAHAIGYVHRDLRPRNLYLAVRRGRANFVKLLDFGLAKLVETEGQAASTSLGMTFGDPRYMSPEQARGDRIDRRADIYQLGCVAYEMLTGAPPFSGNRVFDILTRQVTEAPQPLPTRRPGVPLWMEAAITKMLAKDPENRFATTTRMVEALRRGFETGEVMEDEVARRRESIPPPSVSRVMQRMGLTGMAPDEPGLPTGLEAPGPAVPAATPPAPPVQAAPPAPSRPPVVRAAIPPVAPGATMRAPIAPPPSLSASAPASAPDSVELLRKRTGTPRVGVPIHDPAVVLPAQAKVALPAQPPVAGAIGEAVSGGVGTARPTVSDESQPRGKQQGVAPSELHISQLWYDEGDRLSGGDGDPASRTSRAQRTISPSTADLPYDDEPPPRRRWGLIAGIGTFVIVGGVVVFAMTRGGSQATSPPVARTASSAAAAIDAGPSTMLPASEIVASGDAAGGKPAAADLGKPAAADPGKPAAPEGGRPVAPAPAASSAKKAPAARHPAETHAETRPAAPPRTPAATHHAEPSYPILGSEPTRRTPALGTPPSISAPPAPGKAPSALSVTDSPRDPYGEDTPADGAAPEKKAEFFANLGGHQLLGGDTVSAAGNFKKALELDVRNIPATMGMGEIALRQGLFGDAIAHLSKAVKLSPRNAKALTLLGEAYLNSGNNAQAAAQFKKALQIDPDNARARDGYNEASSRVPPPDDDSQ